VFGLGEIQVQSGATVNIVNIDKRVVKVWQNEAIMVRNHGKNEMTVKTPTKSTATAKASTKAASSKVPKGAPVTEAELLKMSEKDYMNAAQLDFFRQKLLTLKDDILKNASETTEHLRENILVPDPADRATIEEEHALELRTRDRERKLLKKVEQALARIESSDYGWCEETGEPIGLNRLIARPTANLSLEAQERRELRQKLFGD
jgi:DnaK suppressor protein